MVPEAAEVAAQRGERCKRPPKARLVITERTLDGQLHQTFLHNELDVQGHLEALREREVVAPGGLGVWAQVLGELGFAGLTGIKVGFNGLWQNSIQVKSS